MTLDDAERVWVGSTRSKRPEIRDSRKHFRAGWRDGLAGVVDDHGRKGVNLEAYATALVQARKVGSK